MSLFSGSVTMFYTLFLRSPEFMNRFVDAMKRMTKRISEPEHPIYKTFGKLSNGLSSEGKRLLERSGLIGKRQK